MSLGDWSDDAGPEDRVAFGLVMRADESNHLVTVVDPHESPWQRIRVIGRMLNREEALTHQWIDDVFHITNHMATDDPEIKSYFADWPPSC